MEQEGEQSYAVPRWQDLGPVQASALARRRGGTEGVKGALGFPRMRGWFHVAFKIGGKGMVCAAADLESDDH